MKIASIKIAEFPFRNNPSARNAHLFVRSGNTRIHLHVTAPVSEGSQNTDRVGDLIDDGLRQLRQMPGYRRGERRVHVTPNTSIIHEGCS